MVTGKWRLSRCVCSIMTDHFWPNRLTAYRADKRVRLCRWWSQSRCRCRWACPWWGRACSQSFWGLCAWDASASRWTSTCPRSTRTRWSLGLENATVNHLEISDHLVLGWRDLEVRGCEIQQVKGFWGTVLSIVDNVPFSKSQCEPFWDWDENYVVSDFG